MKDLNAAIQDALEKKLKSEGYDLVDLVSIPSRGDRMVRIRTLEEALDDFGDADDQQTPLNYLVQVRARAGRPNIPETAAQGATPGNSRNLQTGNDSIFSQLADETLAHTIEGRNSLPSGKPPNQGAVYLNSGKLNVQFLQKNAELLFAAGDFGLARNVYRTILQSGERSGQALYSIARCFEAEGSTDEAQAHYEESIAYCPSIEAYQQFSALLIRRKKDHQAAEVMERALNIKGLAAPVRFELHKATGNCWMRADKMESAEKHYLSALDIDPASDTVQANLGALALSQGKVPEARRYFQNALAANARSDKALAGLGSCALADGDKRVAHDCFAKSLDVSIQNPTAIFHLVKCAYEIKSYATAARIVGEYIQVAPLNTHLLYSLAGLQFHLGRVAEAQATAQQILELKPDHTGAMDLMKLIEKYAGA